MSIRDTIDYSGVGDYIDNKVNEAQNILNDYDIDISEREVLVGYDMNGPLTDRDSSELQPNDKVAAAIRTVPFERDDVLGAMISGYDINTLQHFRDERLELDDTMEVVGELGSVYTIDGDIYQVFPDVEEDELIELKQNLYEQAAQEERKLLEQGNFSNVVGCTRVEGEGTPKQPRGETYLHIDANPNETTDELWKTLKKADGFDYEEENDRITYESTQQNTKILSEVLRHDHTFLGVRFEQLDDGKIGLTRDRYDDDISLEDAHAFIEATVPDGWRTEHNPDWGTDYIQDTIDVTKERGANQLAQNYFESEHDEYLITHVGDKEGDVLEGDNTLVFPQRDTPAEQYCQNNDIPHVAVRNAWDYSLIMAELLDGDSHV